MLGENSFGILHIEVYTPPYAIKQTELEIQDNCAGKYVKGLGQIERSVNHFDEDVISMALQVVKNMLRKTGILKSDIGRIDVGTETRTDSSKSIASHVQQLLECTDIEGIDCTNACFGGTMALFNSLSWLHSPFWSGKYSIVITTDIAIYEGTPNATGGAAAVCMLLGPNAPLIVNPLYTNFTQHAYDFYKPNPLTGLPLVDGPLSLKCYFNALLSCYRSYKLKSNTKRLEDFVGICCHTPFAKQVEKSIVLMKIHDSIANEEKTDLESELASILYSFDITNILHVLDNKKCFSECMTICKSIISTLSSDSLYLPRLIGNAYCSSLFISIYSFLSVQPQRRGKIGVFAYGSGCMARFYTIDINNTIGMNDYRLLLERTYLDCTTFQEWITKFQKLRLTADYVSEETTHHSSLSTITNWKRLYE